MLHPFFRSDVESDVESDVASPCVFFGWRGRLLGSRQVEEIERSMRRCTRIGTAPCRALAQPGRRRNEQKRPGTSSSSRQSARSMPTLGGWIVERAESWSSEDGKGPYNRVRLAAGAGLAMCAVIAVLAGATMSARGGARKARSSEATPSVPTETAPTTTKEATDDASEAPGSSPSQRGERLREGTSPAEPQEHPDKVSVVDRLVQAAESDSRGALPSLVEAAEAQAQAAEASARAARLAADAVARMENSPRGLRSDAPSGSSSPYPPRPE